MVWNEQWSIKVDGFELNDKTNFITQCPEIENAPDEDVILAQIDGRPPAYIRNQPKEIIYTLLIAPINAGPWATWHSRLVALEAVLTRGTPHTLTVQVRGMGSTRSTMIVVRGRTTAAKERRLAYACVATVPLTI